MVKFYRQRFLTCGEGGPSLAIVAFTHYLRDSVRVLFLIVVGALTSCGGDDVDVATTTNNRILPRDRGVPSSPSGHDSAELTPLERFNALREQPNGAIDRSEAKVFAHSLPTALLSDLFEWIGDSKLPESQKREIQQDIMRRLAKEEPSVGWTLIDSLGSGSNRTAYLGTFIASHTPEELLRSLHRVTALPYPEDQRTAKSTMRQALKQASVHDLREALERYKDDPLSVTLARSYGFSVAATGTAPAAFDNLDDKLRREALLNWAGVSANRRPVEFADQIKDGTIASSDAKDIIHVAVDSFAAHSIPKAADWVISLPDDTDLKNSAVSTLTSGWLRKDSHAASAWVAELNPSTTRDWASKVIVGFLARQDDLEGAETWFSQILDESAKLQAAYYIRNAKERNKIENEQ